MKTPSEASLTPERTAPSGCPPQPADGPLVVIVGPTAVGKTSLSIRLAEAVGGEIVSADSRQVYRGMDLGTAKASAAEQARAPHHLLDVVDPDKTLSLAQYQSLAYAAIDGILARGRVPFLVGGTGQYVRAVVEGWQVPRVPPDEALRAQLYRQAEEEGPEALHARLRAVDPVAAERIDPRNVRRVVRALEVCLASGQPISQQQDKAPPPYRVLIFGLSLPRPHLYRRIDERLAQMMAGGLEAEVRRLLDAGYGFDLPAMSGVGYGQFEPYLDGEATLDEVIGAIRRATRRFVRQQANWFSPETMMAWQVAREGYSGEARREAALHWFSADPDPFPEILIVLRNFLNQVR